MMSNAVQSCVSHFWSMNGVWSACSKSMSPVEFKAVSGFSKSEASSSHVVSDEVSECCCSAAVSMCKRAIPGPFRKSLAFESDTKESEMNHEMKSALRREPVVLRGMSVKLSLWGEREQW